MTLKSKNSEIYIKSVYSKIKIYCQINILNKLVHKTKLIVFPSSYIKKKKKKMFCFNVLQNFCQNSSFSSKFFLSNKVYYVLKVFLAFHVFPIIFLTQLRMDLSPIPSTLFLKCKHCLQRGANPNCIFSYC